MDNMNRRSVYIPAEKLSLHQNLNSWQLDNLGFRNSIETKISDSLLALGCSFTAGVGLEVEETWPHILGKRIGISAYNAGQEGAGNYTAFRFARTLVPAYKPKAVFLLATFRARIEIITPFHNDNVPVTLNVSNIEQPEYGNFGHIIMDEHLLRLTKEKNILAIEQICIDNDVPFYIIDIDDLPPVAEVQPKARDGIHPGPEWQEDIANSFFEKYIENK